MVDYRDRNYKLYLLDALVKLSVIGWRLYLDEQWSGIDHGGN